MDVVAVRGAGGGRGVEQVRFGQVEVAFDYTLAGGASFTGAGLSRLTGGVLSVNGPVTANNFEQTAGTMTGTGNFAANTFAWKNGTLSGATMAP